ncbi:MAG: acyl-CoA dehydrogenase family protein [Pseudomonadota bacterium]
MTAELFDLTPTEEQRMMRESLQRFAVTEMAPIARQADDDGEIPADIYAQIHELGLHMLPVPENLGGAGMGRSPIANVLNTEDLAHGDMAMAIGALSTLSYVNVLLDYGTDAQQELLLPPIMEDASVIGTIAFMEPRATFDPQALQTTAVEAEGGYIINGAKSMVVRAMSAHRVLVFATLDDGSTGGFIVEPKMDGMSLKREKTMGLCGLEMYTLTFEDLKVEPSALLGDGPLDMQRFIDLGRLGSCALSIGVCQAVLDYVVPYCNDREAFGEPITNRQAVAFMIADMATELEGMRLATWRAVSRAEQGMEFHREAYLARTLCSEQAMQIGTNGVQLLGGHGFTHEHPVELWYRNLRAIGLLEGTLVV